MKDLIDRQAALEALEWKWAGKAAFDAIKALPSAQPEQKNEELLPDGTLLLVTDADLSKVGRVLLSQNGTLYCGLYYADGEPNEGQGGETDGN